MPGRPQPKMPLLIPVLLLLSAAYCLLIAWRALLIAREGSLISVGFAVALLGLPGLIGWGLWREVQFGRAAGRLAAELAQAGALPVDELPRRPSGRIVRSAADAAFPQAKAAVAAAPEDWACWFRLGLAYDACADRKRARQAIRRAIALRQDLGRAGVSDRKSPEKPVDG